MESSQGIMSLRQKLLDKGIIYAQKHGFPIVFDNLCTKQVERIYGSWDDFQDQVKKGLIKW